MMFIIDEETEENLQCGRGGGPSAKSGGGGGALATKKASGAPTSAMSQPAAKAVNAAFAELAARGSTGRVQNPRVGGTQRRIDGGAFSPQALKASVARVAGANIKQLQAGKTPKAPKVAKATKKPTNLAEQNRKRIAREKAKAEKARAKK